MRITPAVPAEVGDLEELYASHGLSVFKNGADMPQDDRPSQFAMMDARVNKELFIKARPEKLSGWGAEGTKYAHGDTLHVDNADRIVHLVVRGRIRGYFGHLVDCALGVAPEIDEVLGQMPLEGNPDLTVIELEAGDYFAIDGLRSGEPVAHAIVSLTEDRLGLSHYENGIRDFRK